MNNLSNLYPCLDSIKKNTGANIEILVVAYLFSEKNLQMLKNDYPWIHLVESNDYRGFSENNNLALSIAKGEYCLILNDDTLFEMPVIELLVNSFSNLPSNVAVVSPVTLNSDGSIQRNGKPRYDLFTRLLCFIHLISIYDKYSKYTNREGLYQTYNLSGACFMIRTAVFRKVGWFDERYFFCPEDIALSTKLNELGYSCYVNTSARVIHLGGKSSSSISYATKPTAEMGDKIFYCGDSLLKRFFFVSISLFFHFFKMLVWFFLFVLFRTKKSKNMCMAHYNTLITIPTNKAPKDIFVKFYQKNG
jgi:GT2 family glycosyltransferase